MSNTITPTVFYRTLNVEDLEIFYREAGPRDAPTVLLLHGFPSSSHMFRNLIPMLADKYHVVAPDFPGYGESSAPSVNDFDYSFERLAAVTEEFTEKLNLSSYALYLSDIGASVGFRLAVMHPERVTALVVQNGDAYVEAINKEFSKGLFDYWEDRTEKNAQVLLDWLLTIEGTKWHYLHGVGDPSKISPDNWVIDQSYQDRPGNKDIQLSILYNAKRNLDVYADWQEYFRKQQPPMLITWGKNDGIFTVEGAELFKRDLPSAELHLLDTGHFALEEKADRIGSLMQEFLDRTIKERPAPTHAYADPAFPLELSNGATRADAQPTPGSLGEEQREDTVLLAQPLPDAPGKQLTLIHVQYPPGGASAPHRHPGVTIGYVLSGRIISQVGDDSMQTYEAGEFFVETPHAPHRISRNASESNPASLLAVLISDISAKLVEPLAI
jgi:pimeloyl-ACP methyl ester carboxylesterase/quercetin dioxygenase-like cupin family protein